MISTKMVLKTLKWGPKTKNMGVITAKMGVIREVQLNSSLLKHGSRMAQRDTVNKKKQITIKVNEVKTIKRTPKIITVQ